MYDFAKSDITFFVYIISIITFFVLLAAAIMMVLNIYVCDHQDCKIFLDAEERGKNRGGTGGKEYTISLVDNLWGDGSWPIPYIAAAIFTPVALWFASLQISIKNFAIVFFVGFAVTYFMIGFVIHHYIKFIKNAIYDYINNNDNEVCFVPDYNKKKNNTGGKDK